MNLLEAKHVYKYFFDENNTQLVANNDICLSINQGETYALVGESGSGKSTFARLVAMIDSISSGEIIFKGQDISTLKGEAQRQMRRNIQMVFQDPGDAFSPRMKIKDIVCEPLLNFKVIHKKQIKDKAAELLEQVELSSAFLNQYPHSMSGGQRQRVGVARALALKPELIILDEATSALDMCCQKTIINLLCKIQKEGNITLLFICHDIGLVQSFADRVCVMRDAKIVEILPANQLNTDNINPYTRSLIEATFAIEKNG